VYARSKSQSQNACLFVAEGGNWLAPIFPIGISAATNAGYFLAVIAQARTKTAGDDLFIEDF
jgi:hypothetical protein